MNSYFIRSSFHAEKQTRVIKQLEFENQKIKEHFIRPINEELWNKVAYIRDLFLGKKDKEKKKQLEEEKEILQKQVDSWFEVLNKNKEEIKRRMLMVYQEIINE
jgi:hypothetical protein